MKKILFIILSGFILTMFSCKSNEMAFNPETSKAAVITFGTGGGFTGQVKQYSLTDNGKLYHLEDTTYKLIGKIPTATVDQIFSNFTHLGLSNKILNEPGNNYYFLGLKSDETFNQLKWGANPLNDESLNIYYKILMNEVKKLDTAHK